MPFNGGFAQFERTLDDALRRDWSYGRNIDALLDYARRIRDRQALIVLATDELALRKRHIDVIGAIAATHPVVLITVATANPFDPSRPPVNGMTENPGAASPPCCATRRPRKRWRCIADTCAPLWSTNSPNVVRE